MTWQFIIERLIITTSSHAHSRLSPQSQMLFSQISILRGRSSSKKSLQYFRMHQPPINYIVINSYSNFMHDMRSRAISKYDNIIEDEHKLQLPIFQQMLNDFWQLN